VTGRSEATDKHSTSVIGPTKEVLVTERSEGIGEHGTSVMRPTKEVS
jgi:hypothetical protein